MRSAAAAMAVTLAVSLSPKASAEDFSTIYGATGKTAEAFSHISGRVISPEWDGDEAVMFRTVRADGERYLLASIADGSVRDVSKEEYEALRRGTSSEEESDESYYLMADPKEKLSPDGRWKAFVRDCNIWVSPADPADGSRPVQLSFDGTDSFRYTQLEWSPDSRSIAALRKQELKERQILLRDSHPADKVQPTYRWLDYAKPGDALPQQYPALFNVAEMRQIPLDTSEYTDQYFLQLGSWAPDSSFFTFEYNQRGHQRYDLAAVDAISGEIRTLTSETSGTFVYYYDLYSHLFGDSERMLWISERDGWRHLYLIGTRDGAVRQLTSGQWNVREILRVDEEAEKVYMYANGLHAIHEKGDTDPGTPSPAGHGGRARGEDPYNKHLVCLDISTGKVTDLTEENGFHTVVLSPGTEYFTDCWSRPDMPERYAVRRVSDGRKVIDLGSEDISALTEKVFTMPEVFTAKGRDGVTDIWGTIYRPGGFDPTKAYPVVEYIYAGPHDSHVEKTFPQAAPRFSRLNELGFIVVCIDGMGTDNRSKSFQDVAWRNLKDAGLPDRILWIKAAQQVYPYMDTDRMGIYGYSAGGQNTLSALLFHPEFYKVGVALCGCHDNRMDKIWWNEQWMGYPVGPWYSENSNVDNAWRLEGKLMIVNGEMDDNVDPASSLQVVAELVRNGRYFEQLYLPGYTHNLGDAYVTKRVFEFLWRNCAVCEDR